jgi:hypothetical protein
MVCWDPAMTEDYLINYQVALSAEESFSRSVALGLWMRRPLTAWHFLLPGMFLWNILRRRRAIQQYSTLFLFPRKLALDAGRQMIEGEDRDGLLSRAENKIQEWLSAQKVYSPRVLHGHRKQIRVLMGHYSQLLQGEGESYSGLVRNTYGTRENYEVHVARLTAAEGEVDQGLAEIQGGTAESWDRLRAEPVQVAQLRKKEVDQIFPEGGER